jgi:hypothetical protein
MLPLMATKLTFEAHLSLLGEPIAKSGISDSNRQAWQSVPVLPVVPVC